MSQSLISVVIPVYNTEKYVEKCVESVKNQTYKNVEIILVDDGSPDGSPALLDRIARENENIKVVHKENGGLSSARNAGMEVMTGEYVLFLDSDDTLTEKTLETLFDAIRKENAQSAFSAKYYEVAETDGDRKLKMHFASDIRFDSSRKFALEMLIKKSRAWRATAVLYKTDIIRENNIIFPLGAISEDFAFNIKYHTYAEKIAICEEPTLIYFRRPGSISKSFDSNYMQSIKVIIDTAKWFFDNNKEFENEREIAINSLFCRNVVTYLFSVMSKNNDMTSAQKRKFVKENILYSEVVDAFKNDLALPYFPNKKVLLVYRIEYLLLRFKLCYASMLFAQIADAIR